MKNILVLVVLFCATMALAVAQSQPTAVDRAELVKRLKDHVYRRPAAPDEQECRQLLALHNASPKDAELTFLAAYLYDHDWLPQHIDEAAITGMYANAAAANYPAAVSAYGWRLMSGKGVPADPSAGFRKIQDAMDLNDPIAFGQMGFLYCTGAMGIKRDYAKAEEKLRKAIELG